MFCLLWHVASELLWQVVKSSDHWNPQKVLVDEMQRWWLGRSVFVKLLTRQSRVTSMIKTYRSQDASFDSAMRAAAETAEEQKMKMVCNARMLQTRLVVERFVQQGFDYMAGFMSLWSICTLEDAMLQVTKQTSADDPMHLELTCACKQVPRLMTVQCSEMIPVVTRSPSSSFMQTTSPARAREL